MVIEIVVMETPSHQQNPGLIEVQDQTHKRARMQPPVNIIPASQKERAASEEYQHYVSDTMQALETRVVADLSLEIRVSEGFNIPVTDTVFSTMSGGQYLNDDIINWMLVSWWRS